MYILNDSLKKKIGRTVISKVRLCSFTLISFAVFGAVQIPSSLFAAPPTEEDDKIVFELFDLRFEVDPNLAGRVSSVKYDGEEILIADGGDTQRGSTFWPSPQDWPWPPPAALDSDPFTGDIEGDSIVLSGKHDNTTGLTFRKTYRADTTDTCIVVRYTMINGNNSAISRGGWEITRLPKTGVSFWLKGDDEPTGQLVPMSEEIAGAIWLDWANESGTHKIFNDAKGGWLAHANAKGQFLIKKFNDSPVSKKAPDENEIELYTGSGYFEMEHQGPFEEIAPDDSLIWEVRWYVRQNTEMDIEPGNEELLEFVDKIVNPPPVVISHKGLMRKSDSAGALYLQLLRSFGNSSDIVNIKGQKTKPISQILIGKEVKIPR